LKRIEEESFQKFGVFGNNDGEFKDPFGVAESSFGQILSKNGKFIPKGKKY